MPDSRRQERQPNSDPDSRGTGKSAGWTFAWRALRHRNYRLFFSGQSVSLTGTWMTRVATSWLVYRLTKSAFLLGLIGFSGQIPIFLFGPFAGVWVDRWNRHRVLVVTQALSMLQSFALAALALTGRITFWEIFALSLFQGAINAFDMPARQAFVVEMLESRADLSNAIALNSSMVNGSRLIGPSIAGIVIAMASEGWCFLIDGISYIAVIASLLLMHVSRAPVRGQREHVLTELKQGWQYVSRFVPIRSILLLLALISLVGMPYVVLMPIFAGSILRGGPHTFGFLMTAAGCGALGGSFVLARRETVLGLGRIIAVTAGIFGASLVCFSFSHWLWLSLLVMLGAGYGLMQQLAASNTILQTIVQEDKRGRVMSFYSMAFVGMAPFGSLLAGVVATHIGAPGTLRAGGVLCLLGALWFGRTLPALRAAIRPIYRELGIIPEMAAGLQVASALQTPPED
ncbi:MAG TPA: MFS transporter [Terriglobia bacterium]|nr:MFS transporter [Terriglobia bacterium]